MTSFARRSVLLLALLAAGSACASPATQRCATDPAVGFGEALVCYHDAVEAQPLSYRRTATSTVAGVERRDYLLTSQDWSPEGLVQPASWQHDVALYVPPDALPTRALLISSNGTRQPVDGGPAKPSSELAPEAIAALAQRTRTVVIVLSDLPSQALTYRDDGTARREDDSVAHTWSLFMKAPAQRKTLPLHVPMAAAIARTMSLAERELAPLRIHRFILAGASKRGWASWHAAIADQRVEAVAPFVIDILNMPAVLTHMAKVYGGNWPVAFNAYAKEGMTNQLATPAFAQLVQIQDPCSTCTRATASGCPCPRTSSMPAAMTSSCQTTRSSSTTHCPAPKRCAWCPMHRTVASAHRWWIRWCRSSTGCSSSARCPTCAAACVAAQRLPSGCVPASARCR